MQMSGAAGLAAAKRRRAGGGGGNCAPGGSCSRRDRQQSVSKETLQSQLSADYAKAPAEVRLLYMHERQLQRLTQEVAVLRNELITQRARIVEQEASKEIEKE